MSVNTPSTYLAAVPNELLELYASSVDLLQPCAGCWWLLPQTVHQPRHGPSPQQQRYPWTIQAQTHGYTADNDGQSGHDERVGADGADVLTETTACAGKGRERRGNVWERRMSWMSREIGATTCMKMLLAALLKTGPRSRDVLLFMTSMVSLSRPIQSISSRS